MSTKEDINKYFEEFLKKYQNKECKDIYFLKDEKFPFILQIKQLMKYLKFEMKLENYLYNKENYRKSKEELIEFISDNKKENIELMNPKTYVQNKFYLIDSNWIKKWKNHIGYEEIQRYLEKHKNIKLNTIDFYNHLSPIIEKNAFKNPLYPLDNTKLFNEKGINPLKNFKVINKDCYHLFIIGGKEIIDIKKKISYPVKFLENKYIIILDTNNYHTYCIAFKETTHKKYLEIIIIFDEVKDGKKIIIDEFISKDTNQWLKKMKFNLFSDISKKYEKYNCKFTIINKSLINIKEKYNLRNTIGPNNPNGTYLFYNSNNNISENSMMLIKNKMKNSFNKININN